MATNLLVIKQFQHCSASLMPIRRRLLLYLSA